jgi:hypothetical protein
MRNEKRRKKREKREDVCMKVLIEQRGISVIWECL